MALNPEQSQEYDPTWQLSDQLGPRKSRLLMAGALRHIFKRWDGKLDWEYVEVLEILEEFADTGKNIAAMRKSFREVSKWKTWKSPGLGALERALSNTPQDAVRLLHQALRRVDPPNKIPLEDLQGDLVGPPSDQCRFDAAWRTPAVVQLAKTMYDERRFDAMSRLADELEQAGCQDAAICGHCRIPNAIHMRGCWVIDAVLDGSWNKPPKKSKKSEVIPPKSLLATLPRRDQLWIKDLLERPKGNLSFDEIAVRAWTNSRLRNIPDSFTQQHIDKWVSGYPGYSEEQLHVMFAIGQICTDAVVDCIGVGNSLGLAKRIAWNDPSQFARGVCLDTRLAWLSARLYRSEALTSQAALAVRDLDFIRLAVAESPKRQAMQWDECYFHYLATLAILQRDSDALGRMVAKLRDREVDPTQRAIDQCFQGIFDRSPSVVASSLQTMIDIQRSAKNKVGFGVCDLQVHGLFRLAEQAAPELVTEFEVTQGFPWDREFHEWTCRGEHPLQSLDLNNISPTLHQIIVNLDIPDWFRASPIRQSENPLVDMVLTGILGTPKKAITLIKNRGLSGMSREQLAQRFEDLPWTILSRCDKVSGEHYQKQFAEIGATIELMN